MRRRQSQFAAVFKTVHFLNAAFAEAVGADQFGLNLFAEGGGHHFGGGGGVAVDQDDDRQVKAGFLVGVVIFDRAIVPAFDRGDDAAVNENSRPRRWQPSADRRGCP